MMDLTDRQWVSYAVTHPFAGFEDMRWKKAGSVKIATAVVCLWFVAAVLYNRLYGFQFYSEPDKIFNVIPYFVQTIVIFLTWTVGNWSVCTLLDGEGTMRNIYIYSAYALIPYVASLYLETFLSHFLIRDEYIFMQVIGYLGQGWTILLLFSAIRSVHQYSFLKTIAAICLTVAAMAVMLFLLVMLLLLFEQVYVFAYSIYTEIAYRLKV